MAKHVARKDHLAISREAGLGRVSILSVLAGTLTAYGLFAILAAVAGAAASALDVETEFRTNDFAGSGAAAAGITAIVLLVSYLFGGYVAGRMARRAGILHGVAVFVVTLVVGGVIGGLVGGLADDQDVERNLRSIGVPTTTDQLKGVAIAAVVLSLLAILVGSILGGMLGERWHSKLARRAADPDIGPGAEDRARADREDRERRDRIEHDEVIRRDVAARESDQHEFRDRGAVAGPRDRSNRDWDDGDRSNERDPQPPVIDVSDPGPTQDGAPSPRRPQADPGRQTR